MRCFTDSDMSFRLTANGGMSPESLLVGDMELKKNECFGALFFFVNPCIMSVCSLFHIEIVP